MISALLVSTSWPACEQDSTHTLARLLIDKKLAACVQILPAVQSFYCWQEKTQQEAESLLLIKTTTARYPDVEKAIKQSHPYALPEIMALPITQGLPEYLSWITTQSC